MTALRILHLSDTHLFGDGSKHYGVVDTADHLRQALAYASGREVDLVVVSGDVSEDGSRESYELARTMITEWAAAHGAPAVFAMGNHDSRAAFRAVLGAGWVGSGWISDNAPHPKHSRGAEPSSTDAPEHAADEPVYSVGSVNGWRVVVLDTSVPGKGYGALDEGQLAALRAELGQPGQHHGTVLVMHHPPVAAQTDLLQALALGDPDVAALRKIVEGSDVRAILAGHYHHALVETFAGVPVIVAPGVANIADALGPRGEESSSDSFGGNIIELGGDSVMSDLENFTRVRVLPFAVPVTGSEVFRFTPEQVREIAALAVK